MDYILYGDNRIAKDFRYLFDDLNIISVSDDIESILSDYCYDQIIICDFDKSQKEGIGLWKELCVRGGFFFFFRFGFYSKRQKNCCLGNRE